MKMYLISDNVDTFTGMRLAGVEGEVVHGQREVKQAVEKVLEDKDLRILLITEKLSSEIPELVDEIKLRRKRPLLVEIPDRHGSGRQENFITNYINDAIGIKL